MRGRWHDAFTVGDVLVRAAAGSPDSLAVAFPKDRRSYREMRDAAFQTARSLWGLGVRPGARVGILMTNCFDFLDVLLGSSLLGAVVVPINARFKARELAHVIADGDVEALFTSDLIEERVDFVKLLHETLRGLAQAPTPARLELDGFPGLRSVVLLGARSAPGMLDREEFESLADALGEQDVEELRSRVPMRAGALVMYTSGTTAMPKGCALSHEALVRTAVIAARTRFRLTAQDRFWDPLPLFHMSAILPLIGVFDAGAAFLTSTHFDADVAIEQIASERASVVYSTFPAITQALVNHPLYDAERFAGVRILNNVAPPDALEALQRLLPHTRLISAYGCTECAGVVSFNDPEEALEHRIRTCGRPFDGVELGVRDIESGAPVAAGQRGEIVVRGYSLFDGYHRDPELTARRFDRDGWFHTGDIGALDGEGRVSYLGRIKDMLKVGGENVAAVEIESHISAHPAVSIAAVVGVPDPKYAEVAAAFVELKPGAELSEEQLLEHCRAGLARFKVPHYVRFVDSWPMSATKIQKFRLQEQLSAELEAQRLGSAR
ncbi:MAG: class I adenylate-forming enzyme family protein [Solirubrobacteraceae bacterium]